MWYNGKRSDTIHCDAMWHHAICYSGNAIRRRNTIWSNAILRHTIPCDTIRCDALRYDVIHCDMRRCDATPGKTIRWDAIGYGVIRCDAVRSDTMQCASFQVLMVWYSWWHHITFFAIQYFDNTNDAAAPIVVIIWNKATNGYLAIRAIRYDAMLRDTFLINRAGIWFHTITETYKSVYNQIRIVHHQQ